nr:transposase [Streptomyces halstedii]
MRGSVPSQHDGPGRPGPEPVERAGPFEGIGPLWPSEHVGRLRPAGPVDRAESTAYIAALSELGPRLFSSMPRSDQRAKGMHYLRGLLEAEGRKSIRNIATLFGGDATEQSLHHFITSSTWDWVPVRRALAQYVERVAPPQAYVVHPLIIPRAGATSVGVERRYVPALGQVVNSQQAVGVWAAAPYWSAPLNWRLQLPRRWLADQRTRRQAAIPEAEVAESLGQCSVTACLELIRKYRLPVRPVVMDARETDVATTIGRLRDADTPMLLRIDGALRLIVEEPGFPRRGVGMTAQQIMSTVWHMRRPGRRAGPRTPAPDPVGAVGGVVTVAATTAADAGRPADRNDMLLIGVAERGQWPAQLWLTDLTALSPGELLRLTRLTLRVERDLADIGGEVGFRDFSGRLFTGWHRHITLASAAHTVRVQHRLAGSLLPAGSG